MFSPSIVPADEDNIRPRPATHKEQQGRSGGSEVSSSLENLSSAGDPEIGLEQFAERVQGRTPLRLLVRWVAGIRASVHTKLLAAFLIVTAAVHRDGAGQPADHRQRHASERAARRRRTNWSAWRSRARARSRGRCTTLTWPCFRRTRWRSPRSCARTINSTTGWLRSRRREPPIPRLVEADPIVAGRGDGRRCRHGQCDPRRQAWLGHRRRSLRRQERLDSEITARVGRLVAAQQERMARLRDSVTAANRRSLILTAPSP